MNHCMIDLETLGTQPGSIILSLGAVMFDPTKPPDECLGKELYVVINQKSCENVGMTFSADTLAWWKKQSAEARKVLTEAQDEATSHSLLLALTALSRRLPTGCKVWSNGANFDQPLLDVAFDKMKMTLPWKYWDSRCYRTILALHKDEKKIRPPTVCAHNALEDAKWQARHMVNVAQILGLKL